MAWYIMYDEDLVRSSGSHKYIDKIIGPNGKIRYIYNKVKNFIGNKSGYNLGKRIKNFQDRAYNATASNFYSYRRHGGYDSDSRRFNNKLKEYWRNPNSYKDKYKNSDNNKYLDHIYNKYDTRQNNAYRRNERRKKINNKMNEAFSKTPVGIFTKKWGVNTGNIDKSHYKRVRRPKGVYS